MVAVTSSGRERRLERALVGSSITAAVSGVAAIILAIIGFVHVNPILMMSVAVIIIGSGLLSEAGTLAAEYSEILSRTRRSRRNKAEFGSGFSVEVLAGVAAIVLGILALLDIVPSVDIVPSLLILIAVIILGLGLLFTGGARSLLNSMRLETPDDRRKAERSAHAMLTAATWFQLLVGLAAIVLGALALAGFIPFILTLVGILIIGVAMLLSGVAVSGRMLSVEHKHPTETDISMEEEVI